MSAIDDLHGQVEEPSTTIVSSAMKWGLIHVGVSIGLALLSHLIFTMLETTDTGDMLFSSIANVGISIVGFVISAYLMYAGMNAYKNQSGTTHFRFSSSLGWSAVFIGFFIVLYGIAKIALTAYAMETVEMPEGVADVESVGAVVYVSVLVSLIFSSVILAGIGLVVGLILKTD